MTSAQRMQRWRSDPNNREKERKRHEQWRRRHGIMPQVHTTDEEKKAMTRIYQRRYFRRKMADPVWREKWRAKNRELSKRRYWSDPVYREERLAYARQRYALRKAKRAENL